MVNGDRTGNCDDFVDLKKYERLTSVSKSYRLIGVGSWKDIKNIEEINLTTQSQIVLKSGAKDSLTECLPDMWKPWVWSSDP